VAVQCTAVKYSLKPKNGRDFQSIVVFTNGYLFRRRRRAWLQDKVVANEISAGEAGLFTTAVARYAEEN